MSINTVHASSGNPAYPVLLPNEKIFHSQHRVKVDMSWGSGYPADSGYLSSSSGHLHITNTRLVYIKDIVAKGSFTSLDVPMMHFREGKLKQPWFGANTFDFIVTPVVGGGLPKPAVVKMTFHEGGAFEVSSIVRQLLDRMREVEGVPVELEPLPAYTPPAPELLPNLILSNASSKQKDDEDDENASEQPHTSGKSKYLDEPPAYLP